MIIYLLSVGATMSLVVSECMVSSASLLNSVNILPKQAVSSLIKTWSWQPRGDRRLLPAYQ
jgi:hypothetical protein